MKKVSAFLSSLVFLISGCSFDVHVITPAPIAVNPTAYPSATPIIFPPSETPVTPTDTPVVGFTPETGVSLFYGAHAAENPNEPAGRTSFPAGTKRIYVVWNYQNMRAGLTVKREWYLDGKLWLQREEPWDFSKYGATGAVQDISIYDDNVGLPSGVYQLKMYIDGLMQPIGEPTSSGAKLWFNFEVQPEGAFMAVVSPDIKHNAIIMGKQLIVRNENGTPTTLYTGGTEIPSMVWLSDSQHILFINRDPSGDQLWTIDINTLDTALLVQSDTSLGRITGLILSPDGRFAATSEGSEYGDACGVSLHLLFVEIGADYRGARVLYQKQFSGLPALPESNVYPSGMGSWQNASQFVSPIKLTCTTDEALMGDYIFDLSTLMVVRK
ncbi:MAG: hypothetical protein QM730_17225 [Anaerolineales bacterium]